MPMVKYMNKTFAGEVFQIEECYFVNCVLKECVLFYGGGTFEWENTTFENCQWKFQNEARNTLQLLMTIGLLPAQQKPPETMTTTSKMMN